MTRFSVFHSSATVTFILRQLGEKSFLFTAIIKLITFAELGRLFMVCQPADS